MLSVDGMSTPPATKLALRPPTEDDFGSPLHDERVVARIGIWLGLCLLIAFVTGLISHYQQNPVGWLPLGPSPAGLYRVTQGAHILTGTLSVPLLLAKLYTAYPRLFSSPPIRGLVHGLERLSIGVLIAATSFQLITGLLNIVQWYPWRFSFTGAHFDLAWVAIGSLLIHIGAKLPVIRRALGTGLADGQTRPEKYGFDPSGRTRRDFLVAVFTVAGGIALLTAGQTVYPLRRLALLAPRRPQLGPQGLPVNRTAEAAGVTTELTGDAWRLELIGPAGTRSFSHAELGAMTAHTAELPIACVEGWSRKAAWTGVRVRDLVRLAGGDARSSVLIESVEVRGYYRKTRLPAAWADDPRTLLALRLNGEVLHLEHGYPARIIAPDRPGVLQTKWIQRLSVSDGETA